MSVFCSVVVHSSIIFYLWRSLFLFLSLTSYFLTAIFLLLPLKKDLFSNAYVNNFTGPLCQVMAKILSKISTSVLFLPEDGSRAGF